MLMRKWTPINREITKFNSLVLETRVMSGEDDKYWMTSVEILYRTHTGSDFKHKSAWSFLKDKHKWKNPDLTNARRNRHRVTDEEPKPFGDDEFSCPTCKERIAKSHTDLQTTICPIPQTKPNNVSRNAPTTIRVRPEGKNGAYRPRATLEVLPTDMEAQTKAELNKKAHSAVILCLGNKVMREVTRETTAARVWSKLETLYMTKSLANKLYLKKKLYTFYMPAGRKISEHIDEFNKIILDLANIKVFTSVERESQDQSLEVEDPSAIFGAICELNASVEEKDSLAHVWYKRLGYINEARLQVLEKQGLFGKKSLEFEQLCIESGIARHLTVSETPQQNGLAERMNRTLMDKAQSIEKKTPMEMWSGHPSDYGMFRIFGCVAYPHDKQGKLELRAIKCVLLGYLEGVKGYRLYRLDDESPKIVTSRNVVFNESVMYKDTLKDFGVGADKSVDEL
ncbi:retrovirus-related pol polyprotein from transposon TNT 1-94 [Tanacetum coccineum]